MNNLVEGGLFVRELTNEEWISELNLPSPQCDKAISLLRENLIRGLRYRFTDHNDVDEAAIEDIVQDTLVKILSKLDSFRGESHFITWTFKIAVRTAYTELRKRQWQDVSLDAGEEPEKILGKLSGHVSDDPEKKVIQKQILKALKKMISEDLTEHQKNALVAIMFRQIPLEEVARKMGTNRNSLYKLMYDARKRLKQSMLKGGLTLPEILDAFD